MAATTPELKKRFIFRIEPSIIRRCDELAERRFGGNRSLVIRMSIEKFLSEAERELAESERAA